MSKTTVRQAKELVSIEAKSEFYELSPNAKYFVVFERPISSQRADMLSRALKHIGIDAIVGDANVRIFEFK
jgi:hypothetical protein